MSIMGMRRKFAQHLKFIMWILLIVFIIGIPAYFGMSGMGAYRGAGGVEAQQQGDQTVVARITGENITQEQFDSSYIQYIQYMGKVQTIPLRDVIRYRYQAFKNLAAVTAIAITARKGGLEIGDAEIDKYMDKEIDLRIQQVKQTAQEFKTDPRDIYRSEMEKQGESRSQVSEDDFRQWLRERFSTDKNRKQIEDTLLEQRLRTGVEAAVKVDDATLLASYDEVRIAAIPLIFQSSDKQAEAKAKIDKVEARLKKGENFDRVSKSVITGNNPVDPNQWQMRSNLGSDLEKPVFALSPGEFTAPIKLPSAYVIVKLLAKRRQLPADFEKNKESERNRLLKQLKRDAWQTYRADIVAKIEPDLRSAELIGLKLFDEAKRKEAALQLEKALTDTQRLPGEVAASIAFNLGLYYSGEKNWVKANEAFDAAFAYSGDSTPQSNVTGYPYDIYMYLGKINLEQKKTTEALEYLALAGGGQEYDLHLALLDIYQKMGQDAKAAEEEKWLDAWDKQQAQSKNAEAGQKNLINEAIKDVTSGRGGAPRRAPAPTAPQTSK